MRRARSLLVFTALFVTACFSQKDSAESSDQIDARVASMFRSTWANLDLTIADEQGGEIMRCIRFTRIPGRCQYAFIDFGGKKRSYKGPYSDTCDIRMLDGGVNISVTCETIREIGCREGESYPENTIDQTNSNKILTGTETAVIGLGDQDWQTGSGLCDEIFEDATTD